MVLLRLKFALLSLFVCMVTNILDPCTAASAPFVSYTAGDVQKLESQIQKQILTYFQLLIEDSDDELDSLLLVNDDPNSSDSRYTYEFPNNQASSSADNRNSLPGGLKVRGILLSADDNSNSNSRVSPSYLQTGQRQGSGDFGGLGFNTNGQMQPQYNGMPVSGGRRQRPVFGQMSGTEGGRIPTSERIRDSGEFRGLGMEGISNSFRGGPNGMNRIGAPAMESMSFGSGGNFGIGGVGNPNGGRNPSTGGMSTFGPGGLIGIDGVTDSRNGQTSRIGGMDLSGQRGRIGMNGMNGMRVPAMNGRFTDSGGHNEINDVGDFIELRGPGTEGVSSSNFRGRDEINVGAGNEGLPIRPPGGMMGMLPPPPPPHPPFPGMNGVRVLMNRALPMMSSRINSNPQFQYFPHSESYEGFNPRLQVQSSTPETRFSVGNSPRFGNQQRIGIQSSMPGNVESIGNTQPASQQVSIESQMRPDGNKSPGMMNWDSGKEIGFEDPIGSESARMGQNKNLNGNSPSLFHTGDVSGDQAMVPTPGYEASANADTSGISLLKSSGPSEITENSIEEGKLSMGQSPQVSSDSVSTKEIHKIADGAPTPAAKTGRYRFMIVNGDDLPLIAQRNGLKLPNNIAQEIAPFPSTRNEISKTNEDDQSTTTLQSSSASSTGLSARSLPSSKQVSPEMDSFNHGRSASTNLPFSNDLLVNTDVRSWSDPSTASQNVRSLRSSAGGGSGNVMKVVKVMSV